MDIPLVDPEYPAALDELMDRFLIDEKEGPSRRPVSVFLFALAALLAVGVLWRLTPGVLAVTFFSDRVFRLIEQPAWSDFAWVGLVMLLLGGAVWWFKWRLTRSG